MEDAQTARSLTILIAGMGGQGVVLAGDVLAEAAMLAGLNVKKSEIHGLSRRFGSVSCQIRIGRELYSPLRGHGGVNLLLSLEGYEGVKHLPFLRNDGAALLNRMWSKPGAQTPADVTTPSAVSDRRIEWFEGTSLSHQAECARSLNFFMLGVLSTRLSIGTGYWQEALQNLTSESSREMNEEMFSVGRREGSQEIAPLERINVPFANRTGLHRTNGTNHRLISAAIKSEG
jgi:indolepyruvate ferredoxin oxidoreductase beta subunit